jgi:hypothetical protein
MSDSPNPAPDVENTDSSGLTPDPGKILIAELNSDPGAYEAPDLIPDPGRITAKNAHAKLAEQLAAAATLGDPAVILDFGAEGPAERSGQLWTYQHRLAIQAPRRYQPSFSRLQEALPRLAGNLKKITAKMPDVESYTVQAGFPLGVSVSVTFSASPPQRAATQPGPAAPAANESPSTARSRGASSKQARP